MRILIDARMYGPKGAKGLGRYIQQIIKGLKAQDKENEYIILLTKDNWLARNASRNEAGGDEFEEANNFKKVLAPWRWYTLAEQLYLPRLIKKFQPDLVHFPHFNVPIFYRGDFILTIHDLLLRKFHSRRASTLGPIKFWLKKRFYLLVIGAAIRRAKKIIAVSNFTKKEILKYYPRIRPEKIEVIYEGITKLNQSDIQDDKEVLLRYNIREPFLLYVGNAYPHKNLEKLLLAFKKLEGWKGQLVLVGKKDYFYQRLEGQVQAIGLNTNSVLFLGYIPDQDLASLYHSASLYIFPSLYEGFGLPPLEAMSYGLPVVASEVECLKEVCGLAGEYFNPEEVEEMVKKIKFVLNNKTRQEELRQLGFKQIKKYNWDDTVKKHLAIYHACKKNKNHQEGS